MLFVSIAGEFPYPVQGGPRAITHHVSNTPPGSPSRIAQRNGMTVNGPLEEIILKALSKSPNERYLSAGQFGRGLEAWLAGKPIPISRRGFHIRRWFLLICLAAVLLWRFILAPSWFNGKPANNSAPSFTNSDGMVLVRISAGAVLLDNSQSALDVQLLKSQSYRVDKSFYMSATVVTDEQFYRVAGRNLAEPTQEDSNFPVRNVTRADAVAYCNALSKKENRVYRLPTQTEWRYALYRGLSGAPTQDKIDSMAWYAQNSGLRIHMVAQKSPDRWGLYDMIGNVRQWVTASLPLAPNSTTGVQSIDISACLAEGADYLSSASECLSAPSLEMKSKPEASLPTVGFRIVCESP